MFAEILAGLFEGVVRAVRSEPTEAKQIARAKREVLALSLRLGSDTMLRKLLAKAKGT